ncbi:phosphoribosylaminoimidazole carboxylase, ATPase subunit [Neorickettsia helminthoeca str. Oregon]|uniref:N5-carboxyaminoimidazole ribonucleotide synthase n=1 Tax=Neorickettsia helminthoeca str. Oregon TaxID=1286528 RepID=X5H575_9RICK|nr:5-(carboxyamino)imidazole ribonucleotide synthase [Neorickettsia helminthoeca]AHX11843.1 phosphoribosylaminoimidazole carboxylase, ATPase subunit [Neorickettsia helminthoeca str. Oregon]
MKRIGIFGGGQLGKMIAIAAHSLGFRAFVFAETDDCPAVNVVKDYIIAPFTDKSALLHFAESVDVITFESENVPSYTLNLFHEKFKNQNIRAIEISQNRLLEKDFLKQNQIPTTPYWPIAQIGDLEDLEFPIILKTTRGGYDGRGQFLLKNREEYESKVPSLEFPLIAEKLVDIKKEFSIIVARNETGKIHFPIAENVHSNGILRTSKVPAKLSPTLSDEVVKIGLQISDLLNIKGLICIEFFLDHMDRLMVNELAPRPHNSGHWSMDCCDIDQFEELVLAITDNRLKQPNLILPCIMKNVLGEEISLWSDMIAEKNLRFYNYGKDEARPERKMGHFNILLS